MINITILELAQIAGYGTYVASSPIMQFSIAGRTPIRVLAAEER